MSIFNFLEFRDKVITKYPYLADIKDAKEFCTKIPINSELTNHEVEIIIKIADGKRVSQKDWSLLTFEYLHILEVDNIIENIYKQIKQAR